ncbi:septal ring lytic transglycosylase RlpA family protein [Rhodobium gokarnense]|uniref:Endolytic peptidoglycan transglycosylase RlpA n=1 Tax=Rhodobium gokarnense TaxID=364296 RepID=A0ABT3HAY7_9HYPH|nr:septal ring lytic transglycosylase RlpA family protein [Rhodobium gokarnense]MCW2307569.1 rare lipoprotein A (peptidoglycan hydrolase) [Rhodobium gokarnense]
MRILLVVAVSAMVAACATDNKGSGKRSKEYFSEKKYGVKASPRVARNGKKIRSGGGRYLVGKPYKVAGKWYKPRKVRKYTKTGYASWYGSAFHGRLTANGEVYDMNRLSAAHTTLPLPSYVRVTNLKNDRSVIVRVNDRGPFHGKRVIDLSKRTADLLDFRHSGVAKVKVEYVGDAPLEGHDHAMLMASYRGPGQTAPGGTFPGTMIASATPKTPAAAEVATPARPTPPVMLAQAPVPKPRPFWAATAPVEVAFDPASAFAAGDGVMVASLETPVTSPTAEPAGAAQSAVTGTYSPDDSRPDAKVALAENAADDARRVRTVTYRMPGQDRVATPQRAAAPVQRSEPVRVASNPINLQPQQPARQVRQAVSNDTGLRLRRSSAPVPPAPVGATPPANVGGPFVPVSADASSAVFTAGGLFYARPDRIEAGYQVIASVADGSVPLSTLEARIAAAGQRAVAARADIRLGVFRNPQSIAKLERGLAHLGRIDRRTVTANGEALTLLSLTEIKAGVSTDDAIAAAERLGAAGAHPVR